jgi:ATP phosphoribosyltransferase regulatory subunit
LRTWLLPEQIEDLLPAQALHMENLRRRALDFFKVHGYELVTPPLLEYTDSLLSGSGRALELKTFKLVDQLSGRMLGVRADTTPQVARIDAQLLNRQGVTRLCYAGSVLHTTAEGKHQSRQPFQVGAELFGYAGLEADIEIQRLAIDLLETLGVKAAQLDVGQPSIFRALCNVANLNAVNTQNLFHAIQARDVPQLKIETAALAAAGLLTTQLAASFVALPSLHGDVHDSQCLAKARKLMPTDPQVQFAIDALERCATALKTSKMKTSIDLAELGGFEYENAIVFSVFAEGAPDAICRGGRYDGVGSVFGRARAATGFTLDLKLIAQLVPISTATTPAVLAPWSSTHKGLVEAISALRSQGHIVRVSLPGQAAYEAELHCDKKLVYQENSWQVLPNA